MERAPRSTSAYAVGERVIGVVERLLPYGAFVCLADGTRAYIRRRELSLEGDVDPRQILSLGEEIEAVVVASAKPDHTMELSVRRLHRDPWEQFDRRYRESDVAIGTVKALSRHGAFVQLIPGVDGFVPLREMALWAVDEPEELLWVGDRVEVVITNINRRAGRVRLSIRRRMEQQIRVIELARHLTSPSQPEHLDEPEREELDSGQVQEFASGLSLLGRILVVDDDRAVLDPLVEWLRRQGAKVEGAGSPTQALARLEEARFDLLLLDIDLSGEDGVALIRQVKEASPECTIVVMSVPTSIVGRGPELDELGITEAFAKPLDLDEIEEGLTRIAQGRTAGGQHLAAPRLVRDSAVGSFRALSREMQGRASLRSRLEMGLRELCSLARAEAAIVFCMDPISRKVSIVSQVGVLPLNHGAIYSLDGSPVKDLICEGGDVFELHVSRKARRRFSKLLDLLPFESCIGVPLQAGEEVHHALFLFHREPDAFSHYRLRDAWALAALFGAALESDSLERRARDISRFVLSGELAAGFGHEVYNKISGIEIQVRNLRAEYGRLPCVGADIVPADLPTSTKIGRAIDGVLETVLDLKHVAVSLRELIRAEEEEEIDVNEVIRRAELLLRPTSSKHKVRITTKLAPDLPLARGSATRLQQVFSNVMLNAVQQVAQKMECLSDGWGMLEVASSCSPEDKALPIKVRFIDAGPGVHRQLWERVFSLGFSTRPGGTGLGLYVARSVVEAMGGKIWIEESHVPLGTTFLVELPCLA
jgi:signal transduction histidine kinase/predicted RNA-binding protein with RPS1 domain/ActR/RegA family two-component response regulator